MVSPNVSEDAGKSSMSLVSFGDSVTFSDSVESGTSDGVVLGELLGELLGVPDSVDGRRLGASEGAVLAEGAVLGISEGISDGTSLGIGGKRTRSTCWAVIPFRRITTAMAKKTIIFFVV